MVRGMPCFQIKYFSKIFLPFVFTQQTKAVSGLPYYRVYVLLNQILIGCLVEL